MTDFGTCYVGLSVVVAAACCCVTMKGIVGDGMDASTAVSGGLGICVFMFFLWPVALPLYGLATAMKHKAGA